MKIKALLAMFVALTLATSCGNERTFSDYLKSDINDSKGKSTINVQLQAEVSKAEQLYYQAEADLKAVIEKGDAQAIKLRREARNKAKEDWESLKEKMNMQ